jgi:poly-gamma-glutamate synthesis protein (capsule biosynthesis protein)
VPDEITGSLRTALLESAREITLNPAANRASADISISTQRGPDAVPLVERIYAIVDWFPSERTNIGSEEILDLWHGQPTMDGITTILVNPETLAVFAELWGEPGSNVQTVAENELVASLWANHAALALVPFDLLVPKVKALTVDDLNILDRGASLAAYPLVARTYISGDQTYARGLQAALAKRTGRSNRVPERMTELIMTGVTAISRTSAFKIDQSGDAALPAREVADVLAAADLTHVSNEVPFTEACEPELGTLRLCSRPAYIESLKLAGVDLISSTGNHMIDYGLKPFLDTLDLFDSEGFKVFGGGRDIDEASRVLIVEDHGNRLAFLGMNSFGPKGVWATDARPGAQQYDKEALHRELAEARTSADVVFLDMQADETYEYQPNANNKALFRDAIQNGADVVTGVQAHQPQAVEFTPDGRQVILYGLGNLFFDQMQSPNVRQGLVVRHTIHNGRLIQTELLPTMLEDYVQPRWATPEEQAEILRQVFGASGFK